MFIYLLRPPVAAIAAAPARHLCRAEGAWPQLSPAPCHRPGSDAARGDLQRRRAGIRPGRAARGFLRFPPRRSGLPPLPAAMPRGNRSRTSRVPPPAR